MKCVYPNCNKNIIKRNIKRHIDEVHLKKLDPPQIVRFKNY